MTILKRMGIVLLTTMMVLVCTDSLANQIDAWVQLVQAKRPDVPDKSTKKQWRPFVTSSANSDAFAEDKAIAEEALPFDLPSDAMWTRIQTSDVEYLSECRFTTTDGVSCRFAVYGQYGCKMAYYWTGDNVRAGSKGVVSYEEGTNFVANVLSRSISSLDMRGTRNVLNADDVTISVKGSVVDCPFERFRFILADDMPGANWSHKCRYVFLSEDLSSFAVSYRLDMPKISRKSDGSRIWLLPGNSTGKVCDLNAVKSAVYGAAKNAGGPSESYYAGDVDHSYYVLICGGGDKESNHIRFWSDTAMLYSTLTKKYGVAGSHIYVLMSDGSDTAADTCLGISSGGEPVYASSPTDLDGDGSSDVNGCASWNNLCGVFNTLRNSLTAADQLVVFVTSHGNARGTPGPSNYDCRAYLYSPTGDAYDVDKNDANFTDENLHNLTKGIACPVAFAIETCYAGGFVDDLIATDNRVIATACNNNESSWGWTATATGWPDGKTGKTFVWNRWAMPFISAVRGYIPLCGTTNSAGEPTTTAYPWEDGTACCDDSDGNSDGKVSFTEAVGYAKTHDSAVCTRTTHSSSLCGDVEHPQYGESSSGLGANFFFVKQQSGASVPTVPTIPATPTVTISGTTLSWTAPAGAKYYKVYRTENPYSDPEALTGWITATSYQISKPTTATAYFYFVKAASAQDEATASAFNQVQVVTGTSSKTLLPYSTARNYITYDDNAEFHLYSSSAISATPYSQQSCMQNGTVKFTRSYYTSDEAISATVNGSSVANNPSISANILTKWTMAVSATANTADTPRALAFFSNATTPSGWSGSAGGTYPQYYAMWIGRAHYIYQAGKSTVFVSTPDRDITADATGGTYASRIVARPNATAWTASTTADWITLYRTSSTGCGTLGYIVAANETGSQRVGTITISGASKTGTITVTQPSATVSVDAPTISSVSTSYTSYAKVSWGAVTGAVSYNVYRSTSSTRPNSALKSGITNTYYNDTSADPGVAYYYWVEAVCASSSAVSASKSGYRAVSLSVGASTANFGTSGGGTNISVSANTTWAATTENSWLTLESSSGNLTIVASANTSSASRSGTVLVKAGGSTAHPATKSITVTQAGCPAPVAPAISTVTTTYSSYAKVSWGSVSGATSYNVYRSTTTTKPSTAYASGVTTSYYYDYNATPGVTYYYWVEAVNSVGSATSTSQSGYRAVSLTVGSSAQSFEAGGGSTNVAVSANTSWSATSSETWITFTSSTGTSDGTLAYSVSPNTVTESRSGTITITAGGSTAHPKTVTISVSQAGAVIQPAPSNKEMQVAVSCDYLDFSPLTKYDGIPYWRVVSSSSFADGTALYADGLSSNQWVSVVTEVQGPCVVGWKWACATNGSLCAVQMYLDDKWYAQNNDGAWHVRYCEVTNGTHTLDWCFNQGRLNDNGVGGNACLDTITLYYQVSFDPNGGNGEAVAIADNFVWGTNDDGTTNRYYEVGTQLTLPGGDGLKRDGFDFAGWTVDGDATVYQAGDEYEIGFEPVVFTAMWTESQKTVVKIAKPTKVQTLIYTGSSQQGYSNCDSRLTVSGTGSATAAGMYSVVFTLPAATATETFTWADDTTTAFTINWNIARRDVADSSVTFAAISDQTYTGWAITPTVTMTFGGAARTLGSDYTVAYSSNVNPGTAHVTVTGVGNFTGTKSLDFKIEKIPDPVPVDYVSVASETWYDDGLVFPFDPITVYQSFCQPNDGGTVRTLVISNILDVSLNADCFSPYMVKIGKTEVLMDANSKQMTLASGDVVDVTMNFYPNTRLAIWTFTAEGAGVVLNPGEELVASYSVEVNGGVSCGTMIYATAYFIANGGTPVYSDTPCVCTVASQPDAPTGLSVSFDWNSSHDNYLATLTWNKEWPDGTKYIIYRSSSVIIDRDNPYAEATDVFYTDPDEDLVGGTTNYYAVCAYPDGPYIQGIGARVQAVIPILLEPFTTNYYIEASGISVAKQVNVSANHAWSFEKTTEGAWLHVQKVGTTLQFTADANTGGTRSCEVLLSAGSAVAAVTFIQSGPELVTHTVTFNAGAHGKFAGNKTSVDVVVNDGAAATAPTLTVDSGWKFTAWDKAFDNVTADMTVNALYTEVAPVISMPDNWVKPAKRQNWQVITARVYDKRTSSYLEHADARLAVLDAEGVCYGVDAIEDDGDGTLLFMLNVGFNGGSVSGLSLKYWDPVLGVLDVADDITVEVNEDIGSIVEPVIFEIGDVEVELSIGEGYSWVSIPVVPTNTSFDAVFAGCSFNAGDKIQTDGLSVQYSAKGKWLPATYTVEPGVMYVVKKTTAGDATLTISGSEMDPTLTVGAGYNWLGCPSATDVALSNLVHSAGFADGDKIQAQGASSQYNSKSKTWTKQILALSPGMGYKMKLGNAGTVTVGGAAINKALYSNSIDAKLSLTPVLASGPETPAWTKPTRRQNWQVITARVYDKSTGKYLAHEQAKLAAFDSNGACYGVDSIEDDGDGTLLFMLNIGFDGNSIADLTLKYWDPDVGEIKVKNGITVEANEDIGSIVNPVVYEVATSVYGPLPPNPTPEDVYDALDGSADARLQECITNALVYNAYLDWAAAVTNSSGETVGVGAVKAADHAWFSFAVGSGVLITELPTSDDVNVEAFEPSAESGKFDFTVSVDGVTIGSEALKENLKQVFGLEGSTTLGAEDFSSSNVDITFGTPENGKVKFTAGPNAKNADAKSFFMKVKLTP